VVDVVLVVPVVWVVLLVDVVLVVDEVLVVAVVCVVLLVVCVVVVVGDTQSWRRKLRVLRAVDGSPVPESMKTEYCPEAGRRTAEPGGRPLWIITMYVSSTCGSRMR
jgi:hypothetical protein